MEHYVISMKHTQKRDNYITIWGKDNRGYYTSTEGAGLYESPIDGYHNSPPDSIPFEKERIESLAVLITRGDGSFHCIPNCKAVLDELGFKWSRKGELILA